MNTDIVVLPGRDELERRVREALRPHLVPDQDKFIRSLQVVADQPMRGAVFAGILVNRFTDLVDTNGAGRHYSVPLLRQVVDRFTEAGTIARREAYRRIGVPVD